MMPLISYNIPEDRTEQLELLFTADWELQRSCDILDRFEVVAWESSILLCLRLTIIYEHVALRNLYSNFR